MEWLWCLGGLIVGGVVGFFLGALAFIFKLNSEGLHFEDGKIVKMSSVPIGSLVINFPVGMTDERAEELLSEFARKIRGESNLMILESKLTIEDIEKMNEKAIRDALDAYGM